MFYCLLYTIMDMEISAGMFLVETSVLAANWCESVN